MLKKIGGIYIYVERLLGDVVHGFRQMSNVPRRDSSHRDTAVLNNYLASLLDSKYEEFRFVHLGEVYGVVLGNLSNLLGGHTGEAEHANLEFQIKF